MLKNEFFRQTPLLHSLESRSWLDWIRGQGLTFWFLKDCPQFVI